MNRASLLLPVFLVVATSPIACGGAVSPTTATGDAAIAEVSTGDTAVVTDTPGRVPLLHRASASECPADRPPGTASGPSSSGECKVDADCTKGTNGRCDAFRGFAQCTYDACFKDADCGTGVCACRGLKGGAGSGSANACLMGNCRIDGDCGKGGYCSPTYGTSCGRYAGLVGYYCHTPKDTCIDDADCGSGPMGDGFCAYQTTIGHWACSYAACVG